MVAVLTIMESQKRLQKNCRGEASHLRDLVPCLGPLISIVCFVYHLQDQYDVSQPSL